MVNRIIYYFLKARVESSCFFRGFHVSLPFIISLLIFQVIQAQGTNSSSVREQLRQRIEAAGVPPALTVGDQTIHASITLPLFYERRGFSPAWVSDKGPESIVRDLILVLSNAGQEGVRPDDYHFKKIEKFSQSVRDKKTLNRGELVDLELLCTDAFLIYGSHMLSGRINPETIDAEWFASRRKGDLASVLENAIKSKSIGETLNTLLPRQQEYQNLKTALAQYRSVVAEGGWGVISDGPALKKGESGERVKVLRRRLMMSDDLKITSVDSEEIFDDNLRDAVIHFQIRHGLEPDGAVGPITKEALNVTAQERIQQLVTNLERWRWLPQELEDRYVLINIANFELDVFEYDSLLFSMPVIVGRSYRRTPVFSDRITYLVLNPHWHVPPNLAILDILPAVKTNPEYLAENDFEVFLGWGTDASSINSQDIDWNTISGKTLRYRFRQKPGLKNALGRIKFMFPNQFNVYLHDTPAKGLFAKAKRDFSSGCIRIAKPLELAEYLLNQDAHWTMKGIETALQQNKEQTVRLPVSIPIHILYWTAWSDKDGIVHFRQDIYDRDRPLWEALSEEPPGVE